MHIHETNTTFKLYLATVETVFYFLRRILKKSDESALKIRIRGLSERSKILIRLI